MVLHHYLRYRVSGVEARIAVNDVPVVIRPEPTAVTESVNVNAWLGDDTTEIRIEAAGGLEGEEPAGLLFVDLVSQGPDGTTKTLLSTVCPRDATHDEMVIAAGKWRMRRVLRLEGLSRPPSEMWPTVKAVVLTDDDRVSIHELVMSIQQALDEGDVEVLERELSVQHAEMARAQHCTVKDIRRALAAQLGFVLKDEPPGPVDVESEEGLAHLDETMELHLVARDWLVWVTRDKYAPALRVPATGPGFHMPVYLAKTGDRWLVVR